MTSPSIADLLASVARVGMAAGLLFALAAGVAELGPPTRGAAASASGPRLPRSVSDFAALGDGRYAVIRFPAELAIGRAVDTTPVTVRCPTETPAALAGPGPDGTLLVGFADGAVRRWHPAGSEGRWEALGSHDGPADLLCLSPDGLRAAAASRCPDPDAGVSPVTLWDAAAGVAVRFTVPGAVDWIGFGGDRENLITRATDGALSSWRARDGGHIATIDGGSPGRGAAACAPDGPLVAWCGPSAGGDRELAVRAWDLGGGEMLWEARLDLETDAARAYHARLTYSPDGTLLACGTADAVALFDAADGRLLAKADAAWHRTAALRFAADGRSLVTAGGDGSVRSWGVPSLIEYARAEDHLPD